MVTGIDIVRCQIQVAQGLDAARPGDEPAARRTQMPLYGYALQCRITTEDPANNFVPDYGKHLTRTARRPDSASGWMAASAYGGAVITPYYDSLLVKMTAWGREFRHACQRMDRAPARVPRARREDQHPVPGKRGQPPGLPGGRRHHALAGRDAGAVPVRAAPRPRDQAADLPGRRDRQRQSDGGGQAVPDAHRARRPFRAHDPSAPPDGTRQLLDELGPGEVRRVDRASRSGCCSPTRLSATRTSRCWPRACAPTTCWPSRTSCRTGCTISTAWKCGAARRSTSRMRFLHEDPLAAAAQAARGDPEHLFPDAAARLERRRLHRVSRQRGARSSSTKPPRRASTSSASSIR